MGGEKKTGKIMMMEEREEEGGNGWKDNIQ